MAMSSEKAASSFRYENKFPYEGNSAEKALLHFVKINPNHFFEVFPQRQVNSIYLDDPLLSCYHQNKIGTGDRTKIRIRWYGAVSNPRKPRLEFKVKKGVVGTKKIYALKEFSLPYDNKFHFLWNSFKSSSLPDIVLEKLSNLRPSLIISYQRRYFLSANKKFRITLDWKLQCQRKLNLSSEFDSITDAFPSLLELKYAPENQAEAEKITQSFHFRADRFSKYVAGIEKLRELSL